MTDEIVYTRDEVLSYLPMGWNLADDADPGSWLAEHGRWRVRVTDGADQEWRVEVGAKELDRLGRLPALRAAFDRLYREALG